MSVPKRSSLAYLHRLGRLLHLLEMALSLSDAVHMVAPSASGGPAAPADSCAHVVKEIKETFTNARALHINFLRVSSCFLVRLLSLSFSRSST